MKGYSTAKEKAADWNISTRHVQYLCRMGKIEGAVKLVGAWFIPDDTPIPVKNTKSDVRDYMFVGTKKRIFLSAIELFLLKGFDNVSFKDIGASVGIRQSTIYNHFKSTQEILDTIYDFYCYYYIKERLSLEDFESILQKESLINIMNYIRYDFKEDYEQIMNNITKIVLQRIGIDDRAREIASSLTIDEGIKYVESIFNRAIENGRLAAFDTHTMALFINSIRIFTLYYWILNPSPDDITKLLEDEQALYKLATRLLTDLKFPATTD